MVLSKLKVVEYFDSVINEIDLITEQAIMAQCDGHERGEQLLNERRQVLLSKVSEIQQHCLSQLGQLLMQDEMNNNDNEKSNEITADYDDDRIIKEKVFTKYCFALSHSGLVYLFVVDYYVSDREVDRFKACLAWKPSKNFYPTEGQLLLEILDPSLKVSEWSVITCTDHYFVVKQWLDKCKIFELDSTIIYVTAPFLLENIKIIKNHKSREMPAGSIASCQPSKNKLVRVGKLHVDKLAILESLINNKVRFEQLYITMYSADKEKFDHLMSLLSRGKELFKRVSFDLCETDPSGWTMEPPVDLIQELGIWIHDKNIARTIGSWVFEWPRYWSQLQSLSIHVGFDLEFEYKKLSREHFSCLSPNLQHLSISLPIFMGADALCDFHSLRFLHLETNGHREYDWSFLDSVRDRLETLALDTHYQISSRCLRDMPKLKEFKIDCMDDDYYLEVRVHYDSEDDKKADLFTGLESLEKLEMICLQEEQVVSNFRHFAHLTNLQHLAADFSNAPLITVFSQNSQDSFSCPLLFSRLRSLELYCRSANKLCPRPFSRLTHLNSLVMFIFGDDEKIDVTQELLYGLDSLTHLKVRDATCTVDSKAFEHLGQLVDIDLICKEQTFEQLNVSGVFDQCKSIKSIRVNGTEDLVPVYFDKLDRYVLVG